MITLERVVADDERLARLLQLYLHEWSALLPVPIGEDALFAYPGLDAWRARDARHDAWLFVDATTRAPLGFALVSVDDDGRAHVEELFVIAGARRGGRGRAAARALFATRAGPWTWTVRPENPKALAFWRAVAPDARAAAERGDDGVVRTRFLLGGR